MKPKTRRYLTEIGYTFLLAGIFALGYFMGFVDGPKGDPMAWIRYMIPIILIIKLAAVGLTLNTVNNEKTEAK